MNKYKIIKWEKYRDATILGHNVPLPNCGASTFRRKCFEQKIKDLKQVKNKKNEKIVSF